MNRKPQILPQRSTNRPVSPGLYLLPEAATLQISDVRERQTGKSYAVRSLGPGMKNPQYHTKKLFISNLRYFMWSLARSHQHEEDCEDDTDTDVPESTGCGNWAIMLALGHVDTIECRFWAWQTSTDWRDHIVLRVWDDSQWLQNFRLCKATFMKLCEFAPLPEAQEYQDETCPDS
ncbi:hypothetical protein UY3_04100 [Chelonia mydas]|uniref:Uncharacterized protein n=1 Tax=Chelonia mydas TaxID=8469 RepID=M7BLL6_CHEMY|nr:hypothetical protein UY3_04100 [Chelonia mydas]